VILHASEDVGEGLEGIDRGRRMGVPQSVLMRMSGHRTGAVLETRGSRTTPPHGQRFSVVLDKSFIRCVSHCGDGRALV